MPEDNLPNVESLEDMANRLRIHCVTATTACNSG